VGVFFFFPAQGPKSNFDTQELAPQSFKRCFRLHGESLSKLQRIERASCAWRKHVHVIGTSLPVYHRFVSRHANHSTLITESEPGVTCNDHPMYADYLPHSRHMTGRWRLCIAGDPTFLSRLRSMEYCTRWAQKPK